MIGDANTGSDSPLREVLSLYGSKNPLRVLL